MEIIRLHATNRPKHDMNCVLNVIIDYVEAYRFAIQTKNAIRVARVSFVG